MIKRIKHMAVAVADVDAAVAQYEALLGVSEPRRADWPAGQSREAHFHWGEGEQVELKGRSGTEMVFPAIGRTFAAADKDHNPTLGNPIAGSH